MVAWLQMQRVGLFYGLPGMGEGRRRERASAGTEGFLGAACRSEQQPDRLQVITSLLFVNNVSGNVGAALLQIKKQTGMNEGVQKGSSTSHKIQHRWLLTA